MTNTRSTEQEWKRPARDPDSPGGEDVTPGEAVEQALDEAPHFDFREVGRTAALQEDSDYDGHADLP